MILKMVGGSVYKSETMVYFFTKELTKPGSFY
jgi:hypothetical protein